MKTVQMALRWQTNTDDTDGPGHIRFVAVSATIPNVEDVSFLMASVRRCTSIIIIFYFLHYNKADWYFVFSNFSNRPTHIFIYERLLLFFSIVSFLFLKEYSSLQDNPYNVRCIPTVLIVHNYFPPQGVVNVLISESNNCTAVH